jgi:hypothetical protein
MAYGDLVSRVDFDMKRDSPFSYACHACNRCCRNKAIRVSPYEILLPLTSHWRSRRRGRGG